MEVVNIEFVNLQSHEYTRFKLQPGLNFILANDNNVGKSTIFKVLTAIARAPRNSNSKLDSLMRLRTNTAHARFDYGNTVVYARFIRDGVTAPRLFFETVDTQDNTCVNSLTCPKSLLVALGIVVSGDGDIINFNDADSVQLISHTSVEADKILTHIMLDPDVELIKQNVIRFNSEITGDGKTIGVRLDSAESNLRSLSYNPLVEEFQRERDSLAYLCRIADSYNELAVTADLGKAGPIDSETLSELSVLVSYIACFPEEESRSLVSAVKTSGTDNAGDWNKVANEVLSIYEVLRRATSLDLDYLQTDIVDTKRYADTDRMRLFKRVLLRFSDIAVAVQRVQVDTEKYQAARNKSAVLIKEIEATSQRVECPILGEVYFTGKECLPAGN